MAKQIVIGKPTVYSQRESCPPTDAYFQCVEPLGFTTCRAIEDLYGELGLHNILCDFKDGEEGRRVEDNGRTRYENVLNGSIVDAEQFIVIRLSRWFDKAAMVGDQWVWSRARWIAAYYVSKRRGNEHYFESGYMEAEAELDAIATGEIPPPDMIPLRANSLPSMSNLEVDDTFYLHKLRVQSTISVGGTYPGQDINYYYGFFFGSI